MSEPLETRLNSSHGRCTYYRKCMQVTDIDTLLCWAVAACAIYIGGLMSGHVTSELAATSGDPARCCNGSRIHAQPFCGAWGHSQPQHLPD